MTIQNTSRSPLNRAVLTVRLTLPKINPDGCVGPDDLAEPSELGVHWFKEKPDVFGAMTGVLKLPERPSEADWAALEQTARTAVSHYADQMRPTLTMSNGAFVDYTHHETRTYDEPSGITRNVPEFLLQVTLSLHYASRFYSPMPAERHRYAAHDGWPADITLCNVCHRPSRFCACHPTVDVTAVFEERS